MCPLANIKIQLGGVAFTVKAAESDWLPMLLLLDTDVPQLVEFLNGENHPLPSPNGWSCTAFQQDTQIDATQVCSREWEGLGQATATPVVCIQ